MKRLFLLSAAWLLTVMGVMAQVTAGNRVPDHPRLFLLKGQEQQLKADIDSSRVWTNVHKALIKECDRIINLQPKEQNPKAADQLGVSREYLRRIFLLSYAYRLGGEEKYLEHARRELRHACSFESWNPNHFLDVAEMTMAVAVGYDWLYDKLSGSDRRLLRNAIIDKGFKPSQQEAYMKSFNTVTSNWNQVCHAAIACGAMAVWEDDRNEAATLINRAISNVALPMKAYAPQGVYDEGQMYWEYGTNYNAMLIAALEGVFGSDYGLTTIPGFMETATYYNNMFTPSSHIFSYSDHSGSGSDMPPAIYWFYHKTGNESLLYSEMKCNNRNGVYRIVNNRLAPLTVVWGAKSTMKGIAPPAERFFKGDGTNSVAVMRSSWTDTNGWYMGVKLGTAAVTHSHMDVGSFFIEARGVQWATDLGMENYAKAKKHVNLWNRGQNSTRWNLYRLNSSNHNLVTFDDHRQVVRGSATIDSFDDEPTGMSLTSDLTQVYAGQISSYERSYAMIDNNHCVVTDDITTAGSTTMQWNMMSQVTNATLVADKVVKLERNGYAMYLIIDTDLKIKWEIGDATPENAFETPNKGIKAIRFSAPLKGGRKYQITATFTFTAPQL